MKPKNKIPRSPTVLAMFRRYHRTTTIIYSSKKYEDDFEEEYLEEVLDLEEDNERESD